MAGHKADTVCVGNPWYARISPLFTRNCTWFSGSAKLCFCKTTKQDFPHFASSAALQSLDELSPAITDKTQRCLCREILVCKVHNFVSTVCYILHTPPFINILFCLLVVFTDVIYIWEYVWKTVSMLARNARISVRGNSQSGWLLLCHVGRLVEVSLWTCVPV